MTFLNSLLSQVTKPARYTGGEWNTIVKDWDRVDIKVALAYPDLYEIGMSNLALPILYELFNRQPDVLAERVFAPWGDMERAMRQAKVPLFSLETHHPLREFDIIGFSLGYELTYSNVLNMLDLAQIPLLSSEREDEHPLIIAGGSCALNPEPMADFIDLFVLGDGEEVALEFWERFRQLRGKAKLPRKELLRQLATIPGVYVPSLYRVDHHPEGTIAGIVPLVPEAPPRVVRRVVSKLPPLVTKPGVPYIEVVHDRGAVEIQRGCSRGCRFCQAGNIYRPVRERPVEEVVAAAGEILRSTGYSEISLVSLSTSDYQGVEELVRQLTEGYRALNLSLSLPSLRMDCFSVSLLASLPPGKKMGLTFAPEAGTERLRSAINKGVSEEEILETVAMALEKGWRSLKLYFMLGLPTETMEDVEGICRLVEKIVRYGGRGIPRAMVRVSASTFVPKPHTPFQWEPQESQESLIVKYEVLRRGLRRAGARLSWQDPRVSLLEAVFSRGDRRLGKVLYHAWQSGCVFDAWSEHFHFEKWLEAFRECDLSPSFYAHRCRSMEELLPWDVVDIGVSTAFLRREEGRMRQGKPTPDCRFGPCSLCGLENLPLCQEKRAALGAKSG